MAMGAYFTVLANSYLLTNGDSYYAFGDMSEGLVATTGKDATEAFAQYAYVKGELLDPPRSEYSILTVTTYVVELSASPNKTAWFGLEANLGLQNIRLEAANCYGLPPAT
jgi:hypothetical protein